MKPLIFTYLQNWRQFDKLMLLLIDMAPLYEEVCAELKWPIDKALLAKMQSKNQEKLEKLDETLKDTEENLGETEVRDALYDKAEYLCKIGEKVTFEEKHNVILLILFVIC